MSYRIRHVYKIHLATYAVQRTHTQGKNKKDKCNQFDHRMCNIMNHRTRDRENQYHNLRCFLRASANRDLILQYCETRPPRYPSPLLAALMAQISTTMTANVVKILRKVTHGINIQTATEYKEVMYLPLDPSKRLQRVQLPTIIEPGHIITI